VCDHLLPRPQFAHDKIEETLGSKECSGEIFGGGGGGALRGEWWLSLSNKHCIGILYHHAERKNARPNILDHFKIRPKLNIYGHAELA